MQFTCGRVAENIDRVFGSDFNSAFTTKGKLAIYVSSMECSYHNETMYDFLLIQETDISGLQKNPSRFLINPQLNSSSHI